MRFATSLVDSTALGNLDVLPELAEPQLSPTACPREQMLSAYTNEIVRIAPATRAEETLAEPRAKWAQRWVESIMV